MWTFDLRPLVVPDGLGTCRPGARRVPVAFGLRSGTGVSDSNSMADLDMSDACFFGLEK